MTIEIYLDDLKDEMQQQVISVLGDNGNYDITPITTIYTGEDDEIE